VTVTHDGDTHPGGLVAVVHVQEHVVGVGRQPHVALVEHPPGVLVRLRARLIERQHKHLDDAALRVDWEPRGRLKHGGQASR
jgi:hypothetical protein